ncbi:winged helix-turn-helix domain-containing protein [Nocardia sp. NPDC050710]|uniref:winged helix-turn-helix domain-containing protein n=1 Tax=Nocardia sp. NPDC050710 TaxID=3157220 RepID=UPI00340BF8E8
MRLYVVETGKYDNWSRLSRKTLPEVPAAVPIYAKDRRTALLVLDFDPRPVDDSPAAQAAAAAAVEHDVSQALGWIHQCGGVAVVDRSSRGGMHVLVPLAHGETFRRDRLEPLLQLLKQRLVTFDPAPMMNPDKGCITPPGARCKSGGFRRLVGMSVADAAEVFTTRSAPGLIARLVALIDPQRWLSTADPAVHNGDELTACADFEPGPSEDDCLPAACTSGAPLRPWVPLFLATGHAPDLVDPAGKPWTPSHARLSVLEQHAVRGWRLSRIRATKDDPDWAGFWQGYAHRRDSKQRLSIDWDRAYTHAKKRLTTDGQQSSRSTHKPEQKHTGGIRGIRWKLAAARKWVLLSGHFRESELWSALVTVTSVAYGISLGDGRSVANGGRWLSVAGGLIGEGTLLKMLRKFQRLQDEGSPIRFLAPWNARDHSGDRYCLVTPRLDGREIHAAEWEAYAAHPDPIDPVWSTLGFAAWWCYEILRAIEPGPGESVKVDQLAAAARVSLSTVHRALRKLEDNNLVDRGYGWASRTGRSPRQLPQITADADDRRAARRTRHNAEQTDFWAFVDLINANYSASEISGYATLADLDAETADYNRAVDHSSLSRPPLSRFEHDPPHHPDDDQLGHNDQEPAPQSSDEEALALLRDLLGATLITPPDPALDVKACVSARAPGGLLQFQ